MLNLFDSKYEIRLWSDVRGANERFLCRLWNAVIPERCRQLFRRGDEWQCFFGYRIYPTLKCKLNCEHNASMNSCMFGSGTLTWSFPFQPQCLWCSGSLMKNSWKWRIFNWEAIHWQRASGTTSRIWAETSEILCEMYRKWIMILKYCLCTWWNKGERTNPSTYFT